MGETPNQRVKRDTGSRQRKCVRAQLSGLNIGVAGRSDWSAGVRTRNIDWLGTTHARARTYDFYGAFRYVVAHARVL